jgi:hypothetical protein
MTIRAGFSRRGYVWRAKGRPDKASQPLQHLDHASPEDRGDDM